MRKGQQGESDKEFNERLDAILSLYQFTRGMSFVILLIFIIRMITDRDVFRTFYWKSLAKRLLLQRSASDDFEKAVIKKLCDGRSYAGKFCCKINNFTSDRLRS